MNTFLSIALAGTLALTLTACAQIPPVAGRTGHLAHHPPGASATASPADRMAKMDAHMKSMRDMHERLSRAATPQEREALMEEHMKLMQEGMTLMQGMGSGGQAGMPGMGGMHGMGRMGAAGTPMDMGARQQLMEKRMEMMQSMMQMMMDRMGPPPTRP